MGVVAHVAVVSAPAVSLFFFTLRQFNDSPAIFMESDTVFTLWECASGSQHEVFNECLWGLPLERTSPAHYHKPALVETRSS